MARTSENRVLGVPRGIPTFNDVLNESVAEGVASDPHDFIT